MTITVDIKPEVQAELARQAASNGKPLEDYAARLLEEAVHLPAESTDPEAQRDGRSLVEVCAMVRGSLTIWTTAAIHPRAVQLTCRERWLSS
jgi:hypothetical protein